MLFWRWVYYSTREMFPSYVCIHLTANTKYINILYANYYLLLIDMIFCDNVLGWKVDGYISINDRFFIKKVKALRHIKSN